MDDVINSLDVKIVDKNITLEGTLNFTEYVKSWIVFAHGSGSSHKSPRNVSVARELTKAGHGTFLFDLLTKEEDTRYENRFDIPLLAERLIMSTKWLINNNLYRGKTPIGYFGASTGAAAALLAAAKFPINDVIYAVVSRGGRPDLVDEKTLSSIFTPTLLIIGSEDRDVIELNKIASQSLLNCRVSLVPHATHLFEEPGTMEEVIRLSAEWFDGHVPNIADFAH